MTELRIWCKPDSPVAKRLSQHPHVAAFESEGSAPLEFEQNGWHRRIWIGKPQTELSGLVELIDNNPLVCADEMSLPSPAATLALIALGPLIRAGMILEPPVLQLSCDGEESEIEGFLANAGWSEGATIQFDSMELGGVCACNAIVNIANPEDWKDIDGLYEEAFGRSFFVSRVEESAWDASLVQGKPEAAYRLRLTPGEPSSLLTIQVMADIDGKCGAAQLVHAMNVMAGYEETLGIE